MDVNTKELIAEKFNTYSDMLYRTCFMYLRNKSDAEDVVQDVFYKLIAANKTFQSPLHEKNWLYCVAKNECKDKLRMRSKFKDAELSTFCPQSQDPAYDSVLESVSKLKDKYKDVVILHYFEDYSINEIAAILKISNSAVKMRLSRAREILKLEMGDIYGKERAN